MPPTLPRHGPTASSHFSKRAFHRPTTALGAAGHVVKDLGILSPLLIHEMIKDPEQRWRWIRISAVATALLSEVCWANRIRRERQDRMQARGAEMAL